MVISEIKKRDGRIVKFDQQKITDAIYKALVASGCETKKAKNLSDSVISCPKRPCFPPQPSK